MPDGERTDRRRQGLKLGDRRLREHIGEPIQVEPLVVAVAAERHVGRARNEHRPDGVAIVLRRHAGQAHGRESLDAHDDVPLRERHLALGRVVDGAGLVAARLADGGADVERMHAGDLHHLRIVLRLHVHAGVWVRDRHLRLADLRAAHVGEREALAGAAVGSGKHRLNPDEWTCR